MKNFINYFIKNALAGNLLMALIFIFGLFGLYNMSSTFFPETESKNITINAIFPGSSPEEVEEGIILKIENQLKGLTGIERISSTSNENTGSVNIEVFKEFDTDLVLENVKNAIEQISSFPAGLEKINTFKQENLNFAISFALSGNVPLRRLKDEARKIEKDLRAIDGISKINLSGFPEEEIEIAFRESDLRRYQLTFSEATNAVRAANIEVTGGQLKGSSEELNIRARSKNYYGSELTDIIVKTNPDGSAIFLRDIATVKDQWEDLPNKTYLNNSRSVTIAVQNTLQESLIDVAAKVNNYIIEFNQKNTEVIATVARDGSITLNQRIDLLAKNGYIGFILVLLFLAMFLHWRLAFWVALSIPISFAGMFMVGAAIGMTINVISLFGMILVIGILVDDGIVIGESIYQKYEQGMPPYQAALEGTMEVLPAVFAAIVTTVIAFSAFFFIDGRLGDIFSDMATVVVLTLIFSLIEGAIILPAHVAHSKALRAGQKENIITRYFEKALIWLRDKLYAPVLRFTLTGAGKLFGLVIPVVLFGLTIAAIQGGHIKTTFFPFIERDNIAINLTMPAGTTEDVTKGWLDHLEKAVWEVNEELSAKREDGNDMVLKVQKTVGPNAYSGKLDISLLDGETRAYPVLDITERIRRKAGPVIGSESLTYGSASIFGKPFSISLLGDDFKMLQRAAEALKKEMEDLKEVKDVVDSNQEGLREIDIKLKEKANRLGLNLQQVLAQVRSGFFGSEVQRLQRGEDEVRVWVRYDEKERSNLEQLKDMRIRFLDGREFPLAEIATFSIKRGIIGISHIDGSREVKVEADIAYPKVSVSDVTTELQTSIVPKVLAEFPGIRASFEGQNREQAKSRNSIGFVMSIIGILMFSVIALTFRSLSQAMAVLALIPFGFIGVGFGHWVLDAQISLFSFLGIIALVGILVNDALVYVSTYNQLIKKGKHHVDALYEAGLSRFRPILLTSVTTVAGLGPLILEKSFQAKFLIPMAISVAFGLLFITVIILIMLPVLLAVTNRIKYVLAGIWHGRKLESYDQVEVHHPDKIDYSFLYWGFIMIIVLMTIKILA